MNNLSKELCEICGIKPRYGVYQNFGDLDNAYRLVTNVRKYRLIADTRYNVDDEVLRNLEPIYYPDLTQPENFVKLFKLITTIEKFRFRTGNFYISSIPSYRQDTALTANDEEYYSSNPDPIQAFITCVIKLCKRDKETADFIKQKEWLYE